MTISTYLAKQLSGPRIQSVLHVASAEMTKYEAYLEYMRTISIASAQEQDLEMLGKLVGLPRPLVPDSMILENLFRFISYTLSPSFSSTGFGNVDGTVDGGNFAGLNTQLDSNKMPIEQYRKLLNAAAKIKWNRFSITAIDNACKLFNAPYTIGYLANHDVLVAFTGVSITNLYIAQLLFTKLFDTTPRVQVILL